VITYREFEKTIQFEGVVEGDIIAERRGEYGFGYDPIFTPDGSQLTFAQMPLEEKNKFSHRARAFAKLKAYLMDKMNT
jgi:XTP/dITP diphosphohydrolase